MQLEELYLKKKKELVNYNDFEATNKFCSQHLFELSNTEFNNSIEDLFSFRVKVSPSTNNISIGLFKNEKSEDSIFWGLVSFKCNKKTKTFTKNIKEFSIKNIEESDIQSSILFSNLFNFIVENINYDLLIIFLDSKKEIVKNKQILEQEVHDLEHKFVREKYKNQIQNIYSLFQPVNEMDIKKIIDCIKKSDYLILLILDFDIKDKIKFEEVHFAYDNNTYHVDYNKVKKSVFMDTLKKCIKLNDSFLYSTGDIAHITKINNYGSVVCFPFENFIELINPHVIKHKAKCF